MRKFVIGKNDAGQRADKFVQKVTINMPQSLLYKSFRNRLIRCNGKRCDFAYLLKEGDVMELFIYEEFFPEETATDFTHAPAEVSVIYEDSNILLLDKPSGLLTHGDSHKPQDTLVDRALHYLYNTGAFQPAQEHSFVPAAVNRLDRNTRGLILVAKNFATLQELSKQMKHRTIGRYYLCQVQGGPHHKQKTLVGYHSKDSSRNLVTITPTPTEGSRKVITKYQLLQENATTSWLEIDLITGRSHQIRAHLASIGHPLVGDIKYGYQGSVSSGQRLYAYKISFDFAKAEHLSYLAGKHFVLDDILDFT